MTGYNDKAKWVLDELAKGKSMSEALRAADGVNQLDRQAAWLRPDGSILLTTHVQTVPIEFAFIGHVCRADLGRRVWFEPAK